MGYSAVRTKVPPWWTILLISLALIAIVFDKVGHPSSRHISHERTTGAAYSDHYRMQPVLAWAIGPVQAVEPPSASVPSTTAQGGDHLGHGSTPVSTIPTTTSYTFPGYLVYPENVITSIPIAASGRIAASASWSPNAPLELTLSCGPSDQTTTGSSQAALAISAVDSSCTVALQEQGRVAGPVDYTLDVAVTPS
jgi:hypothetical protein